MEESFLCRKPDAKGHFNRRCMQTVKPRKEPTRQCRLAAGAGGLFCHMHQPETIPLQERPSGWNRFWDLFRRKT